VHCRAQGLKKLASQVIVLLYRFPACFVIAQSVRSAYTVVQQASAAVYNGGHF
jgi:hypothetical protein